MGEPMERGVILVVDERAERRGDLIDRLSARGMTPLAPRTPLETIELLTRTKRVTMLLAPANDFAEILEETFPGVTATEISDDLDVTVDRAIDASRAQA
jgi:hypothetical protein